MTTPTITELYDQLGTMMSSWQRFLDQQMAWQAGPNADNDVSPPNGDASLRGYRVMQDATGNVKNVMTPAQLEKIAKDAVKLITDLNPTELASRFSSLRNDANTISTTLDGVRSELNSLKNQAVSARDSAQQSQIDASTSANNAAGSASSASASASAAASSASSALSSKDSAAGSASLAVQKANDASGSANKAQSWASAAVDTQVETGKYSALHHATKAAASASTATTKAAEASSSANSAASSATTATTKASEASSSATTATTKAGEAANSASSAAASATTATTKAGEASSSASKAQSWATGDVDTQVETGKYSALHHATKAASSASSAQSSASTATTKASEAANSATSASTSASTAAIKASDAASAASTATAKASEASSSATAAANSATTAGTKATAAANSATAAANSATAAANSATASAGSASMAEQYMLKAKNAMYVSTGALVEAGDVSMASGSYPPPLLDAKGNKLATFWKVTAAGVSSDGVDYEVGDTLVYSVATNSYYKIDNMESVTSVNGKKGAVTLTHADVGALAATANAVAALKLATARSIAFTGGASGSGQFDGTQNLSIALTIADDGHKHTFANLKGLPNTLAGYGIIDAASSSHGHSDLLSKAGGAMSGAMTINIASNPTIAGTNFANGWLQVGNSTVGIAIDPNEIFNVGTDLIIGTLTAGTGIQFKPGGGTGSAAGEVKTDGLYSMGSKVLTESAGVAVSASKWSSARAVTFQGGASGSTSIDGTKDVAVTLTVDGNAHDHAIARITGLQSALDSKINVGSAPTKGSTGATGNGVTYTRLASLPANIGSGSCSLHLLVTGGSNFGGNHVPLFSVAFSTRGYSGSGAHTAGMIRAVSLNNSPSSVTFYAVTNATTSRVELWMRRESYSHTVDVTVVNSNGGQLHVDGTTATAPTGDVTEFAPVTLYHSNNKPTLAELGAMSAAGGEMLGSLTLGTNDLIFKGADSGDIVFANADGSQKGRVWHSGSGLMFASTASTSPTAAGSMQLTSAGLTVGGNLVYHAGNKPTTSDIGAVAKGGDTMTGALGININSASTRFLAVVNETDGWTWMQMGKSASANQGHFAWNTLSVEGHAANAFHLRPTGAKTVMAVSAGVVSVGSDAYIDFLGNSTWGGKLRVGGNGRTASNDGVTASVVTTNGNLHLDAASGDRGVYLSFYAGSAGVKFGNGAGSVVGSVDNAGNMSMNGTITAPTFSGNLAGNADSATSATSATYLRNVGNVAPESGATRGPESVLQLRNVYNNGYPTTYGTLLHLGGGGQGQILIGWSDSSGASVPVYVRSKRDTSDASWSEWQQLYSTLHKPTPADIGAMADGGTYGTVTFNNWIRTTGQTGWYNASYGGGIYMTDSTWVRTSHQKKFYVENTEFDAIYTAGGIKAESGITIGNASTGRKGIQGLIADNDYWAIFGAADATNAGRLIIGTGDDGTEPIAVAQYSGAPLTGTPVRTAYLLDGSGNTSFPGVVSAGKFAAVGNGNDYGSGAFEAKGNGTTNTVFPTYGFHQPGLYAGSLQMKTAVDFYFYQQGGSSLANVSANTFNGYLNGTAAVATYLNSGASSTGVTSIASRVNSGFYECSQPTVANGWPVDGSWYHMIATTHSNAGNYYSMQFAADFYNSNNLFFRCTNGNGATGWNRVWHSGNFNPDTKMGDGGTYGTLYLNNWFRSNGATGWFNQTYGGGIYMTDSTWVRTSHQKKFYVDNTDGDAIYTAGGVKALKYMYVSGDWWRDNVAHSWNNNRYTGAPFSVDFYNVPGGSFLPMIASFSTQASVGYSARVKFGVLREAAGWDRIKAAIMVGSAENDGHPLGTFSFDMYGRAGAVTFDASGTGSSQGLAFNGKTAIGGANDSWLRLNPFSNFDTGIYCGDRILRTDGEFQIGGNGSSFKVTAAGAVSAAGQITAPQFNGYLNGTAAVASYLNSAASSTGVTNIASRVNSGFYECSAPTTANGWPVSGSWYHMMASTHSNGSNYYSMQFAADFYNSNNLFFRCTNGNGATGWNQMWHSGNFDPNSKLSNNGSGGTLTLDNWFRSTGNTGWYSETYQGGVYMEDSTYVRVYGGKKFYVANSTIDAISTAGGVTASGRLYAGTTVTGTTGVFDGAERVYSAKNPPPIGTLSVSNLQNSVSPYALLTLSGTGTPTATYASMLPTLLSNYMARNGTTGDIGDIAFMYCGNSMPDVLFGATVAASYLYYGNSSYQDSTNRPSGTWRCLGYGKNGYRTLFIRIA